MTLLNQSLKRTARPNTNGSQFFVRLPQGGMEFEQTTAKHPGDDRAVSVAGWEAYGLWSCFAGDGCGAGPSQWTLLCVKTVRGLMSKGVWVCTFGCERSKTLRRRRPTATTGWDAICALTGLKHGRSCSTTIPFSPGLLIKQILASRMFFFRYYMFATQQAVGRHQNYDN